MMMYGTEQRPRPSARARATTWEARLIKAATFPFFLCAAVATRLAPLRQPAAFAGPVRDSRSVIAEASAAAATCAALAFMG